MEAFLEEWSINEDELVESDELLDLVENRLKELQGIVSKAKRRRNERAFTSEIVRRVATSGFLSTKELGRFLLQTNKTKIANEFTNDFIWETIFTSQFPRHNNSSLESILNKKGHEWVFRMLTSQNEIVRAPEGSDDNDDIHDDQYADWVGQPDVLNTEKLLIIVSLQSNNTGEGEGGLKEIVLPVEAANSLHDSGKIKVQLDPDIMDMLKQYEYTEETPFCIEIRCIRLDTNQTSLKMSRFGRKLLIHWSTTFMNYDAAGRLEAERDMSTGIYFDADIHLEDSSLSVNSNVYTGGAHPYGAYNTFEASREGGVSFFKVMESLAGWM